jgi:peptide/nickel transport system substrate-binding protein
MGSSSPIERIDPLIYYDPGPLGVVSLIFRGLGGWDPSTGLLVPDVAAEFIWERRDDRVVLTCPIRHGVTFHDGAPLTAEDVAYTYRCAGINQLGSPTVEDGSVTFTPSSEDVHPDLLRIGIVPQHLREKDPAGFHTHPVGSGPFAVVEFRPPEIRLRAHEQFVHGAPRLDRLSLVFVNEDEELFGLLRTGEIAVASLRYSKDLQVALEEQGFRVFVLPGPDPEHPDYFTTMHAQAPSLRERDPGAANPNWNANLWHLG